MKFIPYWLDTAPTLPDEPNPRVDAKADVAIIGGGLTGLSAALALAAKGASVTLLEQGEVGSSASGRNGGMCTPGLAISFSQGVAQFGPERAARYLKAYNDAIDTVERLVNEEGIDCDFKRVGKLNLAYKPSHYERLARNHELMAKHAGQETILVPKAEIRNEVGSDYYHGAMVDPLGAGLHVGRFVRGLAASARARGARIHQNTPVTNIRRLDGHKHELETPNGTIRADQVLLATGSKTGRPFPFFRQRIVPVGSYIIATEPLSEEVCNELMPTRRMASDSKNLLFYFRITPDNRLLFGGRARFTSADPQADQTSGRILEKAMREVFPQLARTRIDYCWGGLVDATADKMPRAGVREGLYYTMGYSGHGVQMSTHMGAQMARVMSGEHEANVWHDMDWPGIPGHATLPITLPIVGAYYRFKDMVS
ncbi:NAD(P)/FAD-dependent oxidoreductase [Halomonas ramblicola]|uniref:NAD(P)/FAD-dependent oxidoreductase n=1 Tax=Halomonas ramblicola TaxID=747349 RepID=UPI0025B36C35|nr:FAD-binding oxidoreductase [Halomonas ramblicola]MDN3520469.1 FAD-binding oxidoreductase [Halomonas ramblicola]